MKFYLNENSLKFMLSEKYILREDATDNLPPSIDELPTDEPAENESADEVKIETFSDIKPEIDNFSDIYRDKEKIVIDLIGKLTSEYKNKDEILTKDLKEAKENLDTLNNQKGSVVLPDLTRLISQLQDKNKYKLAEIPEIKNYLNLVKSCATALAYFAKKKSEDLDKIKKDFNAHLNELQSNFNNYYKEIEQVDRQVTLLKKIESNIKFLLSNNILSALESFVKELETTHDKLEAKAKQYQETTDKITIFTDLLNKFFDNLAKVSKNLNTEYLQVLRNKLHTWLDGTNNADKKLNLNAIELTNDTLINDVTVSTIDKFIKLTEIITKDINDDTLSEIGGAEVAQLDNETKVVRDWAQELKDAAAKDMKYFKNKKGLPNDNRTSYVTRILNQYLEQEWDIKNNKDVRRAIKNIYDSFQIELSHLGFTGATNPFISYLHYAFDTMGVAKEIGDNPQAYSALHEAYRQWILTTTMLTGNWAVDINGEKISIGRENIIFSKNLFSKSWDEILKYLTYQNAVVKLFDDWAKKEAQAPNPEEKRLIKHKYLNDFKAFFIDLFYTPGNILSRDAERVEGKSGKDSTLNDIDEIKRVLDAVFGEKQTIDAFDAVKAEGAKNIAKDAKEINLQNVDLVVEKITNNRPWTDLTDSDKKSITDLCSAIIINLKDKETRIALENKFNEEAKNADGSIMIQLKDSNTLGDLAKADNENGILSKASQKYGYDFIDALKSTKLCNELLTQLLTSLKKQPTDKKTTQEPAEKTVTNTNK